MIYCHILAIMGLMTVSEGGPTTPVLPTPSEYQRTHGNAWVSDAFVQRGSYLDGENRVVRARSKELARVLPWAAMGEVRATWAGPLLVARATAAGRNTPLRVAPGVEGVLAFLDENARWFGIRGRIDVRVQQPKPADSMWYVEDFRGERVRVTLVESEMSRPPLNTYREVTPRPRSGATQTYVFEQVFERGIVCPSCMLTIEVDDGAFLGAIVNDLVLPVDPPRYTLAEAREALARQHAFPFGPPDSGRDFVVLRVDRDPSGLPHLRWVLPYRTAHNCAANALVDASTLKWVADEKHDMIDLCPGGGRGLCP